MNPWLICILFLIFSQYFLELCVSLLNIKALVPTPPQEFADAVSPEDYARSQQYLRANTFVSLIDNTAVTVITTLFLLAGGFNAVDVWARSLGFGTIPTGLIYIGALLLLSLLLNLPSSLYTTFVVENRFGFNRMSLRIFIGDLLKSLLLAIVIGGPILALILWFFEHSGPMAWLYCWIGVIAVVIVLQYLAPVIIMPLFNTFTPIADGPLKEAILAYTSQQNFTIQGIFTMDGSKRSTKLNAFFTGFGRFRKIVFYDTLTEKLSEQEIVAVLAHEMGHCKLHHIAKMLFATVLHTGLLFFLLSMTLNNNGLFQAFGMENISIYASLIFFGYLFSPVNLLLTLVLNIFSRRHEFQADRFASKTTGSAENLISGLKKLSCTNLSNLTPHPLYVVLHSSHPPLLERLKALSKNRF
ncbi:MAG: M48 family metallopeptidase [Desulfocapsaceae bacterium]|nr:M48 family metallopeptidase [Desulfocapsaceae bacterium]